MRTVVFFALFLIAPLGPLLAQTAVTVSLTATDPANGGKLPLDRSLYLKVQYSSPEPIRLKASGQFRGQVISDLSNASPIYPAGTADGLVWIAFRNPTSIDAVQIRATDPNWKPLTELTVPIQAEWTPDAPDPAPAAWVEPMANAQQRLISQAFKASAAENDGPLWFLFFILLYLSVLAYPVLQIYSLIRDGWISLSALPLLGMIPLFVYTAAAFNAGSNLWPVLLLFGSPIAVVYLAIIRFCRRR